MENGVINEVTFAPLDPGEDPRGCGSEVILRASDDADDLSGPRGHDPALG